MQLVDVITVHNRGVDRSVMLFVGDLAALPASEAVDILVVSAFPDDYLPTARSFIGALHRAGVSVAELARDKAVDLRAFSSCWLSQPVARPDIHFRRVLCFEPASRGRAPELVGDIFRSIIPFVAGTPPVTQVAMPLVASGDQGEPPAAMLESLADAAVHWLSAGLTLDRVKIVLRESSDTAELREAFARVKRRAGATPAADPHPVHKFDLFISYSHRDKQAADVLLADIRTRRPFTRMFIDRVELKTGAAWQQHIFESLDDSRKVVCLFSPDYLASKVCKEEFNIALMRHRESDSGVLLPLYLRSAALPGYMRAIQYEDAREGEPKRIAEVVGRLVERL